MNTDSGAAKFVRGLVKFVFIGCYAAFMWASIHHVATYFNNFEQNGEGDMAGSYLLAGAFDITALVTTIGVMFFRKSMPGQIQFIVWVFIIAIAGYSFFINWEYAAHFQNATLVLQPTGDTTPVYDQQGNLHYVLVMKANTDLLYINPVLASGFTIFSLIYSVVAEFFGTKPPTIDELNARKQYLEETASVVESIKQLEERGKGKGLIASLKDKAIEGKEAWREVTNNNGNDVETEEETYNNGEGMTEEMPDIAEEMPEEIESYQEGNRELTYEENRVVDAYPNTLSWVSASGSTVSLKIVAETTSLSMKMLHNRVESKKIRATKNKEIVYKKSVINWLITEEMDKETRRQSLHLVNG